MIILENGESYLIFRREHRTSVPLRGPGLIGRIPRRRLRRCHNRKLKLGIDKLIVLKLMAIEVAAGTYLEQSQEKIVGASADSQNQGKTVVDINLVPWEEEFDNTTAMLTCERFLAEESASKQGSF